jgi:SAM-dependent methyltransferase
LSVASLIKIVSADPPSDPKVRYLRAKESVDDRALHRPTLDRVREAATTGNSLRVFEAGPGAGAMLRRLLRWNLPADVTYVGVDADARMVAAFRDRLPALAREAGYALAADDPIRLSDGSHTVEVTVERGDALGRARGTDADLLVAAAFLDLFDAETALSMLLDGVRPGGLAYFPITFDGETTFLPPGPHEETVIDAYHATMDAPGRSGGSRSGRALLSAVGESAATLVTGGGSDWLVDAQYSDDEAYLCRHLVDLIERAVTRAESEDEPSAAQVPDAVAREWAADRHQAVESGELTLLTHQIDALVRAPPEA